MKIADFALRRLADAWGLLHVVAAAYNTVVGIGRILVWNETGAISEAWWAVVLFTVAYYLVREHNRFCEDYARILGVDK
jgi:hypothetical protein